MSWVSAHVAPIAQYGWGAFVLAGLGAACLATVAISLGLIGWRYYRPLPQSLGDAATTAAPSVPIAARLPPSVPPLIATFAAHLTDLELLRSAAGLSRLMPPPVEDRELTAEAMRERRTGYQTYCKLVKKRLEDTEVFSHLLLECQRAERHGDTVARLKSKFMELNALDIRDYCISQEMADAISVFVRKSIEEYADHLKTDRYPATGLPHQHHQIITPPTLSLRAPALPDTPGRTRSRMAHAPRSLPAPHHAARILARNPPTSPRNVSA